MNDSRDFNSRIFVECHIILRVEAILMGLSNTKPKPLMTTVLLLLNFVIL
jgi:hypothetical protein